MDTVATMAEACVAVLTGRLAAIEAHRRAMAADPGVDTVHRFRKDITRLRAYFRLFGRMFDEADGTWLDKEFAALAHPLGDARDLDILLHQLAKASGEAAPRDGDLLREMAASAARVRAAARACDAVAALRTDIVIAGLRSRLTVARLSATPDADRPFVSEAPDRLRRLRERLPDARVRIDKLGASGRHKVRKRMKVLRHGLELVTQACPEWRADVYRQRTVAVLDVLGKLNDLEVCDALARRLFDPSFPGKFRKWRAVRTRDRHLADLRAAWTAFGATRPPWPDHDSSGATHRALT